MVASNDTVDQIIRVLRKHVKDNETIRRIATDMLNVTGSRSVTSTMRLLHAKVTQQLA